MATVGGTLKTVFTMGAIGTALTAGGLILAPIFGAVAGNVAAIEGATNAMILSGFHAPIFTDVAGNLSWEAIPKIFSGYWSYGEAGVEVLGAGIEAGMDGDPVLEAMGDALDWTA